MFETDGYAPFHNYECGLWLPAAATAYRSSVNASPLQLMFGRVVRSRRIELDLSQEDLADKVGLHVTHISNLERGLANITFQNLERLALALHVPLSNLVAEAEYRLRFEAEMETGERKRRPRSQPDLFNP